MRKYRARFWNAGHKQEQVREGSSEYDVRLDIILNYPDAREITVTPLPRSRQYDVRYDQDNKELDKVIAGHTPYEIRQQVKETP